MSLTLEQYERIVPRCEIEHAGTRMAFVTPSMMTKYRVDSIYTKEPCTLDWIAGFAPGEIMVDVGANVGMYSIWAAATRGVNVFSFEPEAQNYALLNRNIQINKLQDKITAFCAGLMDRRSLTALHMADLRVADQTTPSAKRSTSRAIRCRRHHAGLHRAHPRRAGRDAGNPDAAPHQDRR